jgi:urocanate hydratase
MLTDTDWDVMGGVARRNWARNPNAMQVAAACNADKDNGDQITIPFLVDDDTLDAAVAEHTPVHTPQGKDRRP